MNRFGYLLFTLGVLISVGAGVARADYTLYSNTTNFTGSANTSGGASGSGTVSTAMFADDISVVSNTAGYAVNSINFSISNLNTTSASASPTIYIYAADPSSSLPTTLVTEITFSPVTISAQSEAVFNITSLSTLFTVPASAQPGGDPGLFWAGMSFSNAGTATTVAQLNNFGMGLFNPPTVGSSQDAFFQSDSASTNGAANPAGGFFFFGGNPVANFGWAFGDVSPTTVPEPSSLLLMTLAGVTLILARPCRALIARRLAA